MAVHDAVAHYVLILVLDVFVLLNRGMSLLFRM
jgi:hypothetical protein